MHEERTTLLNEREKNVSDREEKLAKDRDDLENKMTSFDREKRLFHEHIVTMNAYQAKMSLKEVAKGENPKLPKEKDESQCETGMNIEKTNEELSLLLDSISFT